MLLEAPGTYNHSLLVSALAESACKDIGADHLIARVGAYYHDIGKIIDPHMFIENGITDMRAKALSPNDYAQLIISHVAKGVQLAQQYKLPPSIIDFIKQHHGKTMMSFFYYKALEKKNKSNSDDHDEEINKANFQYLGPKPSSKEIAVVMLADVIEAASRSIENPNYQKLEGLVNKIIYNKLNDGELEETNLSMIDLNIIKNSFLTVLSGIFHTRIEYPEMNDLKNLEDKINEKKMALS
jgi:putative nucleotidyltransferase with HDIG domain